MSSDFLIAKYASDSGDQLLIHNHGLDEDGDALLRVSISCPHETEGQYKTFVLDIPAELLDEMLDDLSDEREGGEDTEEGEHGQ